MISEKVVSIYGVAAVIVMSALLILVLFNLVPQSLYVPLFVAATAVFIGRIVLRLLLARQKRRADSEADSSEQE